MRAGDLNALTWEAFGPEFATCTFVRRKTRKKNPAPVTFVVPASVRPFIRAWWRLRERPSAGPVFPLRRGENVGRERQAKNTSYAGALRRALLRAGIDRHELHYETATTSRVDFHSTRRGFVQALARAGTNEQTAMGLTGHSDSKVHQRYPDSTTAKEVPDAAVPALPEFGVEHWAATVPFDSSGEHASAAQDTEIRRAGIGSES